MDFKYNSKDIEDFIDENINNMHPLSGALKSGKLIIFVGAGMSVHLNVPGWREFALKYLDLIYENRNLTLMNYKTKESLKYEDTKKILSICKFVSQQKMSSEKLNNAYKKWFTVTMDKVKEKKLYEKLYNMNAIYITTNYDNALDLLAQQKIIGELTTEDSEENNKIEESERGQVYYNPEEFSEDILKIGNVIHIHGSISEPDTMVISYEDYIKKYGLNNSNDNKKLIQRKYSDFLSKIFNGDYVIMFIGYGLEEFEILQYMFDDELKNKTANEYYKNRYLLLPCYCDDYYKINYIANYYEKYYGMNVIPYDITEKGYEKLDEVLDSLNNLNEIHKNSEITKIDELKKGMWMIEEI